MFLSYKNKKSVSEILNTTIPDVLDLKREDKNLLIQGDNINIMKKLLYTHKSKIDLVYIDPPFATNNIFRIDDVRANSVSSSLNSRTAYNDNLLGADFLEFIRERLIFINELMAENSSIYLHIDCKIGHYVKIIMDEIFGIDNFRNDITRIKCNPKNFSRKAYGNTKDMILFYTKGKDFTWNEPVEKLENNNIDKIYLKVDSKGRRYTTIPLHAPGETINGNTGMAFKGILPPKGRHWRSEPSILEDLDKQGLIEWSKNNIPRKILYLDDHKGVKIQDIWNYKDPQYPIYPTEKNSDLLDRIILASSNKNDLVLDCFAGSGSTIQSCIKNNRNFIAIDKSEESIKICKQRLDIFNDDLINNIEYLYIKSLKHSIAL